MPLRSLVSSVALVALSSPFLCAQAIDSATDVNNMLQRMQQQYETPPTLSSAPHRTSPVVRLDSLEHAPTRSGRLPHPSRPIATHRFDLPVTHRFERVQPIREPVGRRFETSHECSVCPSHQVFPRYLPQSSSDRLQHELQQKDRRIEQLEAQLRSQAGNTFTSHTGGHLLPPHEDAPPPPPGSIPTSVPADREPEIAPPSRYTPFTPSAWLRTGQEAASASGGEPERVMPPELNMGAGPDVSPAMPSANADPASSHDQTCPSDCGPAEKPSLMTPTHFVAYDDGFVLRPNDPYFTPFELRVNGWTQFRYTGFARDEHIFTDLGGNETAIENRNDFEVERARFQLSGYLFDRSLEFYVDLNGIAADDRDVWLVRDFWLTKRFSEKFNLHVGKTKVPGSRDWLMDARYSRLADRSMATSFFRPDRTVGVWATGKLSRRSYYNMMIGNGFDTGDLTPGQLDDNFVYSVSRWWVSDGFGVGYSDLTCHKRAAFRLGHSLTFSRQRPNTEGFVLPEQTSFFLSDGTRLVTPAALAPGVTVNGFDTYLYTIDFAMKYRGFGLNAEYFLRWLKNFESNGGAVPYGEIHEDGFLLEVGYMANPKLELVGRISSVTGLFGDRWEYAGGVNYFVTGTHGNKITFDVTTLNGSSVTEPNANYLAGADGVQVRLQWQTAF